MNKARSWEKGENDRNEMNAKKQKWNFLFRSRMCIQVKANLQ